MTYEWRTAEQVLKATCPHCKAASGAPCVAVNSGKESSSFHSGRYDESQRLMRKMIDESKKLSARPAVLNLVCLALLNVDDKNIVLETCGKNPHAKIEISAAALREMITEGSAQ